MRKKLLFKSLAIALLISGSVLPSSAQHFTLSRKNFVDTVKISFWNGAVIIPVEINGTVRNLLFDTGAKTGFWIGEEEEWMVPTGKSIKVIDSQKKTQKKSIVQLPPIKMGNITIKNYPVIVDKGLAGFVCGKFDGALGFDLVARGLSFKFDTKDSLMIVTDRKRFFDKEGKGCPTVKYRDRTRPMVFVSFPYSRIKILFDSGYIGGWIDMPQYLLNRWSANSPKMKRFVDEMTVRVDTMVHTEAGLFGRVTDTVENRVLHIPKAELGGLVIQDLWISTGVKSMKMGSALLEQISLIINAQKKQLVLLPHNGKNEIVAKDDSKRGLAFVPAEEGDPLGALKAVVYNGLEAYNKGIRTGDYLISADGVPITDYCTYFWLSEEKIKHMKLRSPEGEVKEVDW